MAMKIPPCQPGLAMKLVVLLKQQGVSVVYLGPTEHLKPEEKARHQAQNSMRLHAFNNVQNKLGNERTQTYTWACDSESKYRWRSRTATHRSIGERPTD